MRVAIIIGSDSDWPKVKECCITLRQFRIDFAIHVISAHRSPVDLVKYIEHCEKNNCLIYICAAGCAAHLAGAVAAHTTRPVIGIPIMTNYLSGMDSLFSTVQMPSGVPVATVAIDGAVNAAILAVQMLALSDNELRTRLIIYKDELVKTIQSKDSILQSSVDYLLSSCET